MIPFNQAPLASAVGGLLGQSDFELLRKALEAGYGSDMAALTGGGALRLQSLDKTLMAVIQENKHFALFNTLAKTNAIATVDEWTEQSSIGGFPGSTTNTETGTIAKDVGSYARRVALVKYLMTRCEVSVVQSVQTTQVNSIDVENANGSKRLLTDAEYLSFEGDSEVVETEFDGIYKQVLSLNSADHVIDAEGNSLASVHKIMDAAATISKFGNFGQPTHVFYSKMTQADFDKGLDPAYRVALTDNPSNLQLGAPVVGIRTSEGDVATKSDVFIFDEDRQKPFAVLYPAVAAANASILPAAAAAVADGVGGADSKWGAAHAGNYYYAVAGVSKDGHSAIVKSAQVTVAAGGKVTLTIDQSAGGGESGYAIYRSRKNGTNADNDFRLIKRIKKDGAQTVFVDKNRDIPGTSKAYVMNLSPSDNAVIWRQLLPLTKFDLYPTAAAVIPWALLMFGYLRVAKRQHIVVIKNVLPAGVQWRPFD